MYRSRCLPRDDDVKFSPQNGHCLFLGAPPFAGVAESPGECLLGSGLDSDIVFACGAWMLRFTSCERALGGYAKLWPLGQVRNRPLPQRVARPFRADGPFHYATLPVLMLMSKVKSRTGLLKTMKLTDIVFKCNTAYSLDYALLSQSPYFARPYALGITAPKKHEHSVQRYPTYKAFKDSMTQSLIAKAAVIHNG